MASLGLQTRCAKYLSSVVLNAPSNFSSSDIDFMFTNRYHTHENTLHTPRHQDSTKRDSKTTRTVPKKKSGTEGVLKGLASACNGYFKAVYEV